VEALPRPLQARLARAIGDNPADKASPSALAARVIATTDRDLAGLVESGAFSRELYEKLAVVSIRLPPLRERRDDIPLLVSHFLQRMNEQLDRAIKGADDQVIRRFQEYAWPGNVGELETVVKRACIVTRGDVITLEHVADSLSAARLPGRQDVESALCRAVRLALQERLVETAIGPDASPFHDIVALVESTLVREALQITNGNQVKASDLLGVNRATLRKKASGD
jgi:DNA-binding NtrC family response regulator